METKTRSNGHMTGLYMLVIYLTALSTTIQAQMPAAITIDPPNATAYEELTLIFDPALACYQSGSLAGLPSIAMHSGVTFITGEIWQNVVNFDATGYNGQPTTLMPTGDGKYYITYTPADFYGLTGQTVTQLCVVFNNGINWSQDGRDFVPNNTNCMDFFIPLNYQSNNPEFHFNLNMNKMILNGNFDPLSDLAFVEIDQLGTILLTDIDQDGIYGGIADSGIEVGVTYSYTFRINDEQYEDFTREIEAFAGVQTVDVWWNNDPLSSITFFVDMNYQVMMGNFTENDFVDVAGTMNNWGGSTPMVSAGYYLFSITLFVEPGEIEYLFRINGDWATAEFFEPGVNRTTWAVPEHVYVYHYYNDFNWDTWPATFEVDMNAEINNGNFNPLTDYLDIAGSFNNWDGHFVLSDRDWTGPGIYTANILVSKLEPFIEFKFRINGNWATSEFPFGGPNRYWIVQDTTGGFINLFECVYNITDIPYPPYVYDVFISGELLVGHEITGNYTYFDPNADLEGESLYQWFVSEYPDGSSAEIIDGAVFENYIIAEEHYGKYLAFQVTPIAATGDPYVGNPTSVISEQVVGVVGTAETGKEYLKIFPNPAHNLIIIQSAFSNGSAKLTLYNICGKKVMESQILENETRIDISTLARGVYITKVQDERRVILGKIIKQ